MSKFIEFLTKISTPLLVVTPIVYMAGYTVNAGERVVMFNKLSGVQKNVINEGFHIRMPFLQDPHVFNVRTRPRSIPTITGTKDLQNVSITIRVLFRPKVDQLCTIYKTLGLDYDERILPSITAEVLKSVVAQFDAAELITQRENVSKEIRKNLGERAQTYGIILDDISITHLAFSKEFMTAVEMKQVAQQEAERAKFLVEKAEQERNAVVLSSDGDAEAAKLLADAFSKNGSSLVTLRKLEAAEEITQTLSEHGNVIYLPHDGNILFSLDKA